MEIREVYSLQEDAIVPFYFDCIQPFPFFSKNSQARKVFEKHPIKSGLREIIVGVYHNDELLGLFLGTKKDTSLVIDSALIRNTKTNPLMNFNKWHSWVCNIIRWYNLDKFAYTSCQRSIMHEDYLSEQGGELLIKPSNFSYEEHVPNRLGIALGGGGAHGSYQIGVWHALNKLGIDYQVVTGTSVGALNAAFMVQGDYEQAEKVWLNLTTSDVLDIGESDIKESSMKNYVHQMGKLTKSAISSVGASTRPLKKMIGDNVKPKKITTSTKECYIVTVEVPKMKEKVIKVTKKYNASLNLWLLASASFFPMMSATKIENHYYVDGGYRNNIPVDIALKADTTHVFAVDIKGPGITKNYSNPDEKYVFLLKSPWNLGPMLLFDSKRADWNMKLGYLETLKYFRMVDGYYYSFISKKSLSVKKQLNSDFYSYLTTCDWKMSVNFFQSNPSGIRLRKRLRKEYRGRVESDTISLVVLELLGKKLRMSPIELYNLSDFYKKLSRKLIKKVGYVSSSDNKANLLSVNEYMERYIYNKVLQSVDLDRLLQLRELLTERSSAKEKAIEFLGNHHSNLLIQLYMISFIIDQYNGE